MAESLNDRNGDRGTFASSEVREAEAGVIRDIRAAVEADPEERAAYAGIYSALLKPALEDQGVVVAPDAE